MEIFALVAELFTLPIFAIDNFARCSTDIVLPFWDADIFALASSVCRLPHRAWFPIFIMDSFFFVSFVCGKPRREYAVGSMLNPCRRFAALNADMCHVSLFNRSAASTNSTIKKLNADDPYFSHAACRIKL